MHSIQNHQTIDTGGFCLPLFKTFDTALESLSTPSKFPNRSSVKTTNITDREDRSEHRMMTKCDAQASCQWRSSISLLHSQEPPGRSFWGTKTMSEWKGLSSAKHVTEKDRNSKRILDTKCIYSGLQCFYIQLLYSHAEWVRRQWVDYVEK